MNTPALNKLYVIDIETVPQVSDYTMLSDEWQQRWWRKLSKTVPENCTPEESYRQKAGILAEFGKIICISIGCFHEKDGGISFMIKSIYGNDEKKLLTEFIAASNKFCSKRDGFQFAGHNIPRVRCSVHLQAAAYQWIRVATILMLTWQKAMGSGDDGYHAVVEIRGL